MPATQSPDTLLTASTKTVTRNVTGFAAGFLIPFRGFAYMWQHKALWRFGVWPAIFNTLITLGLLALVIVTQVAFHQWWEPPLVSGWIADVIEIIVGFFIAIIAIGLAVLLWAILHGVLCGYFYGVLAAEVERKLGIDESEIREVPFTKGLIDVARDLRLAAIVFLGVLLLQLIPIPFVSTFIAVPLVLYFQYLILGRDFLDHPLSLRGARWHQKRKFISRHRLHTLGLGLTVSLIAFIPIVSAVLLTTAVTGATLSHRNLAAQDAADNWDWRNF